jgi:hypothetical protein
MTPDILAKIIFDSPSRLLASGKFRSLLRRSLAMRVGGREGSVNSSPLCGEEIHF